MDELELIREAHGSPRLDPWLKTRVRARLAAQRQRARRRLFAWSAALTCVVIAAAALWFGVPRGSAGPGRTILLAAATSAMSGEGAQGAYWHLREQTGSKITELWAARDGRTWRGAGAHAEVTTEPPFSIAGRALTYQQIQRLPTDPAALRAWVNSMLPAGAGEDVLADALSGLLWRKPSPPGVRASAYRLLADLPNVHYLGKRTDGRGRAGDAFSYALGGVQRTLIVDPASSRVLSSSDGSAAAVILEAGFTDEGPAA
ncbi:hypothetical protein J5X84_38585 [Streptosporangiaceae bacterium NEAU-GS5]|nr:hypothetical protein [Streptosporangiaceae bacterium NEAU-GS5]